MRQQWNKFILYCEDLFEEMRKLDMLYSLFTLAHNLKRPYCSRGSLSIG